MQGPHGLTEMYVYSIGLFLESNAGSTGLRSSIGKIVQRNDACPSGHHIPLWKNSIFFNMFGIL